MSGSGGPDPTAALRPARPRRARTPPESGQGSPLWQVSARLEELGELVWSVVDVVAEIRDGIGPLVRDIAALRAAQSAATRTQPAQSDALPESLDGIRQRLDDLCARQEEILDMLGRLDKKPPATPPVRRSTKAGPAAKTPRPTEAVSKATKSPRPKKI